MTKIESSLYGAVHERRLLAKLMLINPLSLKVASYPQMLEIRYL